MIFVTVGTTQFDSLIRAIDEIAAEKSFALPFVCQIGSGKFEPQHCEWFRFAPSIQKHIKDAELVITHGGATTLQLIKAGKKFVAMANTALADDHQSTFLKVLADSSNIVWDREVSKLKNHIETALASTAPTLKAPKLGDAIVAQYL